MASGLTQLAFIPAINSAALPRITTSWQQRMWDHQLFEDADVRKRLQQDDVLVTDWRELMRRFEGRAPSGAGEAE